MMMMRHLLTRAAPWVTRPACSWLTHLSRIYHHLFSQLLSLIFPALPICNVLLCPSEYFFLFDLCHITGVGWCFAARQPEKCLHYDFATDVTI